jgi:hypothetical protein
MPVARRNGELGVPSSVLNAKAGRQQRLFCNNSVRWPISWFEPTCSPRAIINTREAHGGADAVATSKEILDELDPQERERLGPLLVRAEQGDATALPELRAALDQLPQLWSHYGDLSRIAAEAWVDRAAGANLLLREALDRKLAALRAELAGPSPSALEQVLADQMALAWLQTCHVNATVAQARMGEPYAERKLALQRQESSLRRLVTATKQLALVRKLLRPPVSPFDVALRDVPEEAAVSRRRALGPRAQSRSRASVLN